MKDGLLKLIKKYGLYVALTAALIISAIVAALPDKSENDPVIIYAGSSSEDSIETEASSRTESVSKKTTTSKVTTTKVTTTKAPKTTTSKTTKVTTVKTTKAKSEKETTVVRFPIDINRVTFDELIAINGVGEGTANAILSFRASVGVITYMEQLLEIPGIGENKLAMLSGYLYVDDTDYSPPPTTTTATTTAVTTTEAERTTASTTTKRETSTTTKKTTTKRTTTTEEPKTTKATTSTTTASTTATQTVETEPPTPERQPVNINEANAEELAECLLIDEELAKSIVAVRIQLGGRYENYLQLLYVKGISKEFLAEIRDYIEI